LTDKNKTHKGKSSTGMEENVVGLLCYVLGFITGIIFLVIEKDSKFVKFHAMQSIILFASLFILDIILGFIPILGWLISLLLFPLSFILWLILMFQAYQGKLFKLPVIGDIAEKQASTFQN
jgi:uncharacterized membrane protein